MPLSNSTDRYGSLSKMFHWATALLILTLIPTGWFANKLPFETDAQLAQKVWLFSLHKTLGVAVFFVALARMLWTLRQPKPGLLHPDRKLESLAAETVHWLLYGALALVPLSGWIAHAAAAGFAPIWWPFGQGLPLVPKSTGIEHFFTGVHLVATKVLIAALGLHIAGALKHHIIDRDDTLRRMLPGRHWSPVPPQQNHTIRPFLGALAIWAIAVALGGLLASPASKHVETAEVTLEEVTSDWQVNDGSIDITVIQFGNEVTGSFADWTAQISFDETLTTQQVGSVKTTIAIPSLTLGSVTQQALGPDFFDAGNHATAVFDATLQRAVDGYEAVGTLTLRGKTVPLTMFFSLDLAGDTADVSADLSLDRRAFDIGNNVSDAASLAFNVKVAIRLQATRQ